MIVQQQQLRLLEAADNVMLLSLCYKQKVLYSQCLVSESKLFPSLNALLEAQHTSVSHTPEICSFQL